MRTGSLVLVSIASGAVALVAWVALDGRIGLQVAPRPAPPPPAPTVTDVDADPSSRAPVEVQVEDRVDAAAPTPWVRGRVVDAAGQALGGLLVGVQGEDTGLATHSAPDGRFELRPSALPCWILALDPSWVTVTPALVDAAPLSDEVVVVAAPAIELAGRVVDRAGRGLFGARLTARRRTTTPHAEAPVWTVASGTEGRFRFERLPRLAGLELRTALAGWREDLRSLDLPAGEDLTILLEPDESSGPEIEGIVVRPDGSPVPGALVAFGSARARTDAKGAYRFFCAWFAEATPLVASARGFQPAVIAGYGARIDRSARSLATERIVLAGPPLAIEGRVVTSSGQACKGWSVVLENGTRLDPDGFSSEIAESLNGGRGESVTDSAGVFRIEGLCDRPYTLLAFGRSKAARLEILARARQVPAGATAIVLTAPDAVPGTPIRGRVLLPSGAAAAGARVGIGRPWLRDGPLGRARPQRGFETTADADGRFELQGSPVAFLHLVATGSDGAALLALEADAPRVSVEIRLHGRRRIAFDGSRASPRPDALQVIRADGSPPSHAPYPTLVRLVDGACGPVEVSDQARHIVLYRGCAELGRLDLPASTDPVSLTWP